MIGIVRPGQPLHVDDIGELAIERADVLDAFDGGSEVRFAAR